MGDPFPDPPQIPDSADNYPLPDPGSSPLPELSCTPEHPPSALFCPPFCLSLPKNGPELAKLGRRRTDFPGHPGGIVRLPQLPALALRQKHFTTLLQQCWPNAGLRLCPQSARGPCYWKCPPDVSREAQGWHKQPLIVLRSLHKLHGKKVSLVSLNQLPFRPDIAFVLHCLQPHWLI